MTTNTWKYENLWNVASTVYSGGFIGVNAYI